MPARLPSLPACLVVVLAMAGGCARHRPVASGGGMVVDYSLPTIERGTITADVDDAILAQADPTPPPNYVALGAAECQCLAVQKSMIGNLLDRERGTVCGHSLKRKDRCAEDCRRRLLSSAAREARNKNAAAALRLYYGIAETESGLDAVAESEPIVADVLAKAGELKANQLTVPFDRSEWRRQQTALAAKRIELIATRDKLNAQLRSLLGHDSVQHDAYFWPTDPLTVDATPLDAESEVGYGLATRPELQLLRDLQRCGPEAVAEIVRSLLGQTHGLLGLKMKLSALHLRKLLGLEHDCEPCARFGQLGELVRRREEQIGGEIRAAVRICEARRREAAEMELQIASWQSRIDELQQKKTIAESSFVEIAEAKLRLIEAKQAVVTAAINYRRAQVDLHEAQGALVAECVGPFFLAAAPVDAETVPPVPSIESLPLSEEVDLNSAEETTSPAPPTPQAERLPALEPEL